MSPKLYPFQRIGAAWLGDRDRALLADEMGIGKSAQAICAADELGAESILVLCKAIGKDHWVREFQKFSTRGDRFAAGQVLNSASAVHDAPLHVINYDIIHYPKVLHRLLKRHWDVIIMDEMHMLKGGETTRRGQAALDPKRGIWTRGDAVWGLSGTPAPNHPGELYPWLKALHPDLVQGLDWEGFLRKYLKTQDTPYGTKVTGTKDKAGLQKISREIMLRRKRTEVLPELPPLTVDHMTLTSRDALPSHLMELEDNPAREEVLAVLKVLGQEASPEQVLWDAGFHPAELRRLYGLAKAPLVAQQVIDELESGQDKVVIMGWHRDVIFALERYLDRYNPVTVVGGTKDVTDMVLRFQNDPSCRVFLGNILSAGTTITLTAANRLIFAEYSWTPADNEQALLRILRIGQERPCRVSYLSLAHSLDEVITGVFQRKAALLESAFNQPLSV